MLPFLSKVQDGKVFILALNGKYLCRKYSSEKGANVDLLDITKVGSSFCKEKTSPFNW
jgi:hypothetical protein